MNRSRFRVVLEAVAEAESATIRSAVKFYFNIDVSKKISTFSKNIFSVDEKYFEKFWVEKKKESQNFQKSLLNL